MRLAARIADREIPVDGFVFGIELGDVDIDVPSQSGFIGNAAGKAGTPLTIWNAATCLHGRGGADLQLEELVCASGASQDTALLIRHNEE